MSSILALPSPAGAPSPTGLAKLRQMLASDAVEVKPVRRVPGEEERRRSQQSDATLEATDDALKGSGRAEADQTRARARATGSASGGFAAGAGATGAAPISAGPLPQTALPNAGFVAQSLHQEVVGGGLHIEPWSDAIQAYKRADAGVNMPLVTQVSV